MTGTFRRIPGSAAALATAAGLAGLGGCAIIGPSSIGAGREAYAEAITATSEEQILQTIVRDRYEERLLPLRVSSVTANVRFSTSAGLNVGMGPSSAYDGNLVPLSAGVAYEENPIISYKPMDSAGYLQQLLSPIPLNHALLLIRMSGNRRLVGLMLLERINGLKNPTRPQASDSVESFERAVDLLTDFLAYDLAEFVALDEQRFGLLLQVEEIRKQTQQDNLIELMRLLELNDLLGEISWSGEMPSGRITGATADEKENEGSDTPPDPGPDPKAADDDEGSLAGVDAETIGRAEQDVLVIPIRFSAVSDGSTIAMTTRSVYDIVRIAASRVDVPEDEVERGLAIASEQDGLSSRLIRISRSETRPTTALVATQAHGWWWYIDESDIDSKRYFRILHVLFAAQIASTDGGSGAPLLTVPVGR